MELIELLLALITLSLYAAQENLSPFCTNYHEY
jgi:hypothetical protein